jgi:hypothetical protein
MAHIKFHRPTFYRYVVADPGTRICLNRYPGAWVGTAVVIGQFAYCTKWGWAR